MQTTHILPFVRTTVFNPQYFVERSFLSQNISIVIALLSQLTEYKLSRCCTCGQCIDLIFKAGLFYDVTPQKDGLSPQYLGKE